MVTIAIALMIVIAVAVVAWPIVSPAHDFDASLVSAADPVWENLIVQRDAAYAAIKDLEFDREMGKLSDADYKAMRAKLETKAVGILQELDVLQANQSKRTLTAPGDETIEREIQRLRRRPVAIASGSAKCPKCGTIHTAGDAFCAKCGSSLRGARCPNCGTRAAIGDKFCARCGAHVKA